MTDEKALMQADAERRAAMVAGDLDALEHLLANDLTWTHSSGKTDSRSGFLDVLGAGTTVYHTLDTRDTSVRQYGDVYLLDGVVFGDVTKDGQDKKLINRFLTVWRKNDEGSFQLHAWQSTGLG